MRTLTQPSGLTGQRDWEVSMVDGNRIVLTPTQAGLEAGAQGALTVARDVIRRRIDPGGTEEITSSARATNRIVVQVPGPPGPRGAQGADRPDRAARVQAGRPNAIRRRSPRAARRPGSQILPMPTGGGIAVQRRAIITGDQLADASRASTRTAAGRHISFDSAGARRFGRATQENVGKPFAIILDDKVLSAPNINEPILGGTAPITGSFTVESANELAISPRAGCRSSWTWSRSGPSAPSSARNSIRPAPSPRSSRRWR